MEFIESKVVTLAKGFIDGTLKDINEAKVKSEEQAMYIFTQISLGLLSLHLKGIAHKDLRPENIYVDGFGRMKIGGLIKVGSKKKQMTIETIPYLAPEIHLGQPNEKQADIWSLGVILFELITGNIPFSGQTEHQLWQ